MIVEIRNKNSQKTYLNVTKIISYRHMVRFEFIGEQGETLDRIIPDKDTEVYVRDKDDAIEEDTCKIDSNNIYGVKTVLLNNKVNNNDL